MKKPDMSGVVVIGLAVWAIMSAMAIYDEDMKEDPLYYNRSAHSWKIGVKESKTIQLFFPAYKEDNVWKNVLIGDNHYDGTARTDPFYLGENIKPLVFDNISNAMKWIGNRNESISKYGGYRYYNDTEGDTAYYNGNVTTWKLKLKNYGGNDNYYVPMYKEKGKWVGVRILHDAFKDSSKAIKWLNAHVSKDAKIL